MSHLTVTGPHELKRMPDEYRELLLHQLRQHVEGELIGANDYLHYFYPLAPDGYEKKVCCDRASEEIDHFMLGAEVLKDMGFDASYMLNQSISDRKYYKTEGVVSVDTWLKRGFFSFIGEAAVLEHIEEMACSSYLPLARMTRQVIIDEYVHVAHGKRIVEKFIRENGAEKAQDDFSLAWAMSMDLFGKSDSERSKRYLRWGLRKYSNQEARDRFCQKMIPVVTALGLKLPEDDVLRKFR